MKLTFLTWFPLLCAVLLTSSCTTDGNNAATGAPGTSFKSARKSSPKPKPYPFNHCAVIKKPFDRREGAKHRRVHDGYEVLFCCTPCVRAFDINPEAFMGPIRAHYAGTEL